ncbi:hypothetical protein KKG66_11410 [bacterium]|nr:hypothetical protein [bacterium]
MAGSADRGEKYLERSQITRSIAAAIVCLALLAVGCANPFAPALRGEAESVWTDASTIGEMLQNFATAYELRDSLRYAELLDESFQFSYYNTELGRNDGWFRETDLLSTSRLFRSFQDISLIWSGLDSSIEATSTPDIPIDVVVHYQLILEDLAPLLGFARFKVIKPEGERFRILLWQDEF